MSTVSHARVFFVAGLGLSLILVTGCGGSSQPAPSAVVADDHDEHAEEGVIHIETEDLDRLGIELAVAGPGLSLIHISEPTRLVHSSRMPSSA